MGFNKKPYGIYMLKKHDHECSLYFVEYDKIFIELSSRIKNNKIIHRNPQTFIFYKCLLTECLSHGSLRICCD